MYSNITRRDFFWRATATTGILFLVGSETSCSISQLVSAINDIVTALQGATPILETLIPPPWNALLPGLAALLSLLAGIVGNSAAVLSNQNGNALRQVQMLQSFWKQAKVKPGFVEQWPDTPLSVLVETSPQELVRQVVNSTNAFLLEIAMTQPGVSTEMQEDNAVFALKVPAAVSYGLATYAKPVALRREDKIMLGRVFNNTQALQAKIRLLRN